MNYRANFIEDMTYEQIDAEIERMYYEQYAYGRTIDRPRLWDLEFTHNQLIMGADFRKE